MTVNQDVFERHEKKYILTKSQYNFLEKALPQYMENDQYGLYCICSLYFDTDDYQLIRNSIEKPVYKEKLRLRSYGVPTPDQIVYMELKKKFKGITYKRRMPISYKDAWNYNNYGIKPKEDGQIFKEIDWFTGLYHTKPKVLLFYERIALFGKEDNEFRITFDFNIRFRENNLDMSKGSHGTPLLDKETVLMEVKTLKAIPYWFSSFLSDLHIYPYSFSKYGTVYKNYLFNQEALRNVQ